MRRAPRPLGLVALALAMALVVIPGCAGDDEAPEATPTATRAATATATSTATPTPPPTPTPSPPPATPTPASGAGATPAAGDGLLSPELSERVVQLLIEAMGDPDSELFSGSVDALPPEIRALLDALGADLQLGVVIIDLGGTERVVATFPGSPAERAGLVEGDEITAIDGAPVGSGAELRTAIEALDPGTTYTLTVLRGGAPGLLDLEREPASEGDAWRADLLRAVALTLLMADGGGADLPPSLLGEFVEETPDGLRVFAVFPGSPAEAGGLRPGDVLVSIGGRPLATIADLDALTRSFVPSAEPVEVVLLRDGEELTLAIDLAVGGLLGGGAATQ